jgi:hypothetical protein
VIPFLTVKPKPRRPLEDNAYRVYRDRKESISKQIDDAIEMLEKKFLAEQTSNSVNALSGGRPESNRRKF